MSRTDLVSLIVLGVWICFVSVAAIWAIQDHLRPEPTIQIVETVASDYVL